MLQQTRVAAVLEHYRRFLQEFPKVEALAAARLDQVLAAWSGLGYYRRARMMRACARELVARHGGRFPENADTLRQLPGIGRYTASAVASIAFGEPVAVVDGNVQRVLQRIADGNLTGGQMWERAQQLLSPTRPGDFNQAMMELGATVCLPAEPHCPVCPACIWCATGNAAKRNMPNAQVTRAKSTSLRERREIWCALDRRDGHLRMVQRPRTASVMAGMWELPLLNNSSTNGLKLAHWRTFRHSITKTDYTVHVLQNLSVNGRAAGIRGKWIAVDRIPQMPITGLARKILKAGKII